MLMPIIARGKGLNALITGTIANLNLKTWLMSNLGWDGTTPYPIDVTIDASAIIYGSTTANYALTISGFPAGTALNLINNGLIIGAGGAGGKGGSVSGTWDSNSRWMYINGNGNPGGAGGNALNVSSPVSITNNSKIYGGGGGGGGSAAYNKSGNGGGGGGGMAVGAAGSRGDLLSTGVEYGLNGNAGTTYAGGSGGYASWSIGMYSGSISGGAGGAPGSAGGSGGNFCEPYRGTWSYGAAGGPAGKYAVGNSNITWITAGDRRGGVS